MVRSSARFLGIVPDGASLLIAVDDDNGGIQIENQTVALLWKCEQVRSETVVKANDSPYCIRGQSLQKSPNGGLIGKSFQTEHLKKGTVVLEYFRFVDTTQTHNYCVNERKQNIDMVVIGCSLKGWNISLQQSMQIEPFAKTLY
jgi:hypothetical protein